MRLVVEAAVVDIDSRATLAVSRCELLRTGAFLWVFTHPGGAIVTAYHPKASLSLRFGGIGGESLEQQPSPDETVSIGPRASWCAMIQAPVEPIPRELRDQRNLDDQALRPANEQLLQPD